MKMYSSVALVAFASLAMVGCGGKKIDSRQIDLNNGLAYEHGSDTPFSGDVIYKNTIPNNLADYWDREVHNALVGGPAAQYIINGCTIHYSAGAVDGPSFCVDSDGNVVFDLTNKNETWDGVSKLSNPSTGKVVEYFTWGSGSLDGKVKLTTWDGKNVLKEGKWSHGSIVSGKIAQGPGSIQYSDGKKNGPAILSIGSFVYGRGIYKDDQMDGPWVNSPSNGALGYQSWLDNLFRNGSLGDILIYTFRVDSNWVNGQLDGKISFYGTDGSLVAYAMTSDGSLVPESVHLLVDRYGKFMPSGQADAAGALPAKDTNSEADAAPPTPNDANAENAVPVPPTPEERASANAAALASQAAVSFGNPSYASPAAAAPVASAATAPQPPAAPPTPAANAVTSAQMANTVATGNTDGSAHAQAPRAYQAGFDCTKAQTPTETTICADPVLSALDADVSAQYRALAKQADASQKSALLSRQRTYLTVRGQCSDERSCIERLTRSRFQDLREQAAKTPGALISTLQSDKASGP